MVSRLIIVFLLFLYMTGESQTTTRDLFSQLVAAATQQLSAPQSSSASVTTFWEKSGPAQLGYLILSSYQQVISSQDVPACNFYPSCSHFAQDALTHTGFPKNLLLISDRLQRCNGLPGKTSLYPFLPEKGRYYDPITNYLTPSKKGNR